MSRKRASAQSAPWARPSNSEAVASSPTATGGAGGQPEDRVAQRVVLGAGEHEERDLGAAHDAVDQREGERQVAEGFRHAERDEQQRRHRAEDDQAHRALLGVDHAGQPGVAGPGPPEHAEHQQALGQARPGRVVRHQRRALGDRQHEDEVEEELQRRYPLAFAQGGAEAGAACFARRRPSPPSSQAVARRGLRVSSAWYCGRAARSSSSRFGKKKKTSAAPSRTATMPARVGPARRPAGTRPWRRR